MTDATAGTGMDMGLASCHTCTLLVEADRQRCPRCGTTVHLRETDSLQRTLALLITATLLYIPANLFPIMYTDQLGRTEASTILGGVTLLIKLGSAPIAAVIFIASVCVPLGKLIALYYLVWTVGRHSPLEPRQRTAMYRITELIGKWSMVDVFVVAILVALVNLGGLLVIRPGIAALSFAGVVIVTMVAAETFDSRLIWDEAINANEHSSA
ncbi:MAG: paraquat-inducible protein A [Halieaceae bacterium]|jgi:paraquat-inducible protein A|nr:paraquat-inducible protein A [Halieaceae bacterium]